MQSRSVKDGEGRGREVQTNYPREMGAISKKRNILPRQNVHKFVVYFSNYGVLEICDKIDVLEGRFRQRSETLVGFQFGCINHS